MKVVKEVCADYDNNKGPCFQSEYLQFLHKYSSILLFILIGVVSYWLVALDNKVDKGAEARVSIMMKQSATEEWQKRIMESLFDIKADLMFLKKKVDGKER